MNTEKYRLKQEVMGRPAGTVVTMHSKGVVTSYVIDPKGDHINAPTAALEPVESAPPAERTASVEPELVARLIVNDAIESEARAFYDDYCAAVGGVAFNGDPLPPASEFFEDPKKQKQANAYRVAADLAYDRFVAAAAAIIEDDDLGEIELLDISKRWSRVKFEVTGVKEVPGGEDITMAAVAANRYGEDGLDENNSYAHFSPSAHLDISVRNPNLIGKVFPGTRLYADFTEAPDSAPRKPAPPKEEIEEVRKSEDHELETAGTEPPSNGSQIPEPQEEGGSAPQVNGVESAPLDVVDGKPAMNSELDGNSPEVQDATESVNVGSPAREDSR